MAVEGAENVGNREKSFAAALDVVKLFSTLSAGALAFSIGLVSQATNNFPGGWRTAIIVGWFIFFAAIVAGVWAQMLAPILIKAGDPDPNDSTFRGTAYVCVVFFLAGVALLGVVLVWTLPHGAPGERLKVTSPAQAIAKALGYMNAMRCRRRDNVNPLPPG